MRASVSYQQRFSTSNNINNKLSYTQSTIKHLNTKKRMRYLLSDQEAQARIQRVYFFLFYYKLIQCEVLWCGVHFILTHLINKMCDKKITLKMATKFSMFN